ncbi:UNVERIFIED_CONTAM: hypothetical protein FKN15_052626 [Acipenser sinensis]
MTELEIDQSHLPQVQEVCQGFAVLEDGALAHNLQKQEIEQYYASNVQKNQLVQRDVRIAKRLQDEEDQRRQLTDCRRQIEEQDSEYAQTIQEDLRRRAEEARRREEQDEEIARFMQRQEMKASRDPEGQGSRMEHGDLTDSSERRRSQNRKAEAPPGWHERLDSEGLPSPREEGSPDRRASPAHRQQQQHLLPRNIAEELDPTFRVKRQEDAAEEPALPTPAAPQSPPGPPCRFHDYADERAEPTFIPPTKRQSDKISRPKTKDRKEGCKQQ